jgi:hypothetical protein
MCKDLLPFPHSRGNGNKYGKNNQRGAFEMGKTDSGKAGEVQQVQVTINKK